MPTDPQQSNGYLPLPDYLTIKPSDIHGLGLFAAEDLPAGKELGISHVADTKKGRFPNDSIRTPLGGFINHSSEPNCQFYEEDDTWRLRTLRAVKKGEELTGEYTVWYDEDVLGAFN